MFFSCNMPIDSPNMDTRSPHDPVAFDDTALRIERLLEVQRRQLITEADLPPEGLRKQYQPINLELGLITAQPLLGLQGSHHHLKGTGQMNDRFALGILHLHIRKGTPYTLRRPLISPSRPHQPISSRLDRPALTVRLLHIGCGESSLGLHRAPNWNGPASRTLSPRVPSDCIISNVFPELYALPQTNPEPATNYTMTAASIWRSCA